MKDTKQRLLATGERLFRAQGYSGTGLKQLAQEAEAPWSSMYHFFPDRESLLSALWDRHIAAMGEIDDDAKDRFYRRNYEEMMGHAALVAA